MYCWAVFKQVSFKEVLQLNGSKCCQTFGKQTDHKNKRHFLYIDANIHFIYPIKKFSTKFILKKFILIKYLKYRSFPIKQGSCNKKEMKQGKMIYTCNCNSDADFSHTVFETRFLKISPNVTLKYAELHNSMFP